MRSLVAFAVFCFFSSVLYCQNPTATVTGQVTDQNKNVIPDAKITVINESTNIQSLTTTNATGTYYVADLPTGNYRIEVEKMGFKSVIKPSIVLHVQEALEVNFEMAVGSLTETVTVEAAAPTVELTTPTLSGVVDSTTVRELPLNGRDWTQLATLQAGVNSVSALQSNGLTGSGERVIRGNGDEVTIGGTRPQQNNYRIDGVSINDYTNDIPGDVIGYTPGVDAIGEFTVLTSNYSAAYGKTSGGVIESVTKSGTNQLHGTAYEFLRNSALDSRNYFDPATIPEFRRNQFGGAAGGPIKKDNTFFFGDYEGFRQNLGITQQDVVPSANARNGIITNANGTTTTVPVVAAMQPFLGFWPQANGPLIAPGNTAILSLVQNQIASDDFADGRVDHRFSNKDSISVAYQYDNSSISLPDSLNDTSQLHTASRQLVAIEETHTFNSQLLNTARFGFARDDASGGGNTTAINSLAANASLASVPGQYADPINVAGLTNFAGGLRAGQLTVHHFNSFQGYDDVFLTSGIHTLRFGVSVERDQDNMLLTGATNVAFGSLTNFLMDKPSSYKGTLPKAPIAPRDFREGIFGVYVQDDVRPRSNLVFNLGLRYEMSTVPTEASGKLANLPAPTASTPVVGNTLFSNPTLRNFEPRIGFAWDPFKNGKTSIRGGFGLYDVLPLAYGFIEFMPQVAPFYLQGRTSSIPAGDYPSTALSLLKPTTLRDPYVQPDPKRNYVMQWNFSAERELVPNLTMTLAYVGSRGVHMPLRMGDMDIVLPTLTPEGYLWPGSGTRINPNFGRIDPLIWGSDSYYDALQASLVKRMSHGLQVQGSYSWGRAIDTGSGSIAPDSFANGVDTFYFNPGLTRGPADFNVSQNLTISYTWLIPTPTLRGFAEWAVRGWELGGIFTARTGLPFTPLIAPDPLGEGNASAQDFPDRVPGCSLIHPGSVTNYINLSCFTVPMATPSIASQCVPFPAVAGSCENLLGNGGRNEIVGPGEEEFDFSLFKNTYVRENFNVQFRIEAFNVFNHSNFNPPIDNSTLFDVNGAPVGGAGLIDSTSTTNRQIQFGLKLIW